MRTYSHQLVNENSLKAAHYIKIKDVTVDLLFVFVVQGGGEARARRRAHHPSRVLLPLSLLGGCDLREGPVAARLPQPQPPRRRRLVLPLLLHFSRHLPSRLSGLRGREGQRFSAQS